MENTESSIVKVCVPVIIFKAGVSLDHGVSFHFILLPALQTLWIPFQAKNNLRSASASTAQVLHRSHNTHTSNRHLCGSGEKNGAQRRTKVLKLC